MRLGIVIAAISAGALVGGCGAADPPPKPQKPVQLTVSTPSDTSVVQGATAQVSGTVSPPGASVRVQGHAAQVSGSTFTSTVSLDQGANVIDVSAAAVGRATAMTAFRVTREEHVRVPAFVNLSLDDARTAAAQRGLKLTTERGGGFLDPLVPRRMGVCDQTPSAGADVRRGTTVKLLVARAC